tara:strand:- start:387 stop:3335 length:2949 start_codon:yes stop_codon:yes gene_type:complete
MKNMKTIFKSQMIALLACISIAPPLVGAQSGVISESDLSTFKPRLIGPAVTGGRIHNLAVLPGNPSVIFVASASGGLWKTTNRGHTWRNIFADQTVSTFGDVAIAPSNTDIVYAGTGEQNNRQSTSWGNGVYRSDDAGETWQHLGLTQTRHIGKVIVNPINPEIVYVAALGNLWQPSEERGVFRSLDGGQSWEKTLFVDSYTGAVDLVINPEDPSILYAATYQRLRRTWGFNGGGPGSAVYKSEDSGATWKQLTNGIPTGDKGRIGLAISESNPNILNALIEHADASAQGTYRTENGGNSWAKVSSLNPRPMYYSKIFIDPSDSNRVYVLATSSYKSEDGGATFSEIAERPTYDVGVHADQHAVWINPSDPNHFYLAGDGGLWETYDQGDNFRKLNNIPIGQIYALGLDNRDPYYVYVGMQDNHSWMGPSRTRGWIGITNDDWRQTGFGDGMYQQPNPIDHRFVYGNSNGGGYYRFDPETGDMIDIRPRANLTESRYRWDWVSPSLVSSHDPARVYLGGNRLFVSQDNGESWTRTEDLTRREDRNEMELMGVRGADITISANDGTSSYGEIVVIAESTIDSEVLWVGTDDGNLQMSRDGGTTWNELSNNVQGVRNGTYVSRIASSILGPEVAYVAFDAHRDGDFSPYLFVTKDFGETWTPLMNNLPSGSINSFLEHPDNPNTLFVGTEHSVFVSTNSGSNWAKLENLPTTAMDDMAIHPREKDLVIGTHGQSVWILDDTSPLAEWALSDSEQSPHIFSIRDATIFNYKKDTSYRGQAEFHGTNPVSGAIITYRLGEGSGPAIMHIQNPTGETIRSMSVPPSPGTHRVNWDLRHSLTDVQEVWKSHDDPNLARPIENLGAWVSPGIYTVQIEARGTKVSQSVTVKPDPLMPTINQEMYEQREAFLLDLRDWKERIDREEPSCFGQSNETDRDLCQIRREILQLEQGLTGGGVRPGSLYPPTKDHQARKSSVNERLINILRKNQ